MKAAAVSTPTIQVSVPTIQRSGNFLVGSAVVAACLWVLVPLYFLAANALSPPKVVTSFPKPAVPQFDLESLHFFATYEGVATALLNSVLVATTTMILAIVFGAPAGYALARFDFPGKSVFRMLVLITRAFPLPLLALPLTVFYIRTGLDDTVLGLAFVHTTLALPFAILITASLFMSIPVELEEAAWTLGCTRFGAFRRIVLPLAIPGIGASAVFAFVTSWNEVFAAAVLTVQNRPLTAFLLQSLDVSPLPLKFAGAAALVLPTLVFLFAVRKYLFSLWGIANR